MVSYLIIAFGVVVTLVALIVAYLVGATGALKARDNQVIAVTRALNKRNQHHLEIIAGEAERLALYARGPKDMSSKLVKLVKTLYQETLTL